MDKVHPLKEHNPLWYLDLDRNCKAVQAAWTYVGWLESIETPTWWKWEALPGIWNKNILASSLQQSWESPFLCLYVRVWEREGEREGGRGRFEVEEMVEATTYGRVDNGGQLNLGNNIQVKNYWVSYTKK